MESGSPVKTHNGEYMAAMTEHNRNQMCHITQSPERSITNPSSWAKRQCQTGEDIALSHRTLNCVTGIILAAGIIMFLYSVHLPYSQSGSNMQPSGFLPSKSKVNLNFDPFFTVPKSISLLRV